MLSRSSHKQIAQRGQNFFLPIFLASRHARSSPGPRGDDRRAPAAHVSGSGRRDEVREGEKERCDDLGFFCLFSLAPHDVVSSFPLVSPFHPRPSTTTNNSAVAGVALPVYHTAAAASDPSSSKIAAARRRRWLRYWCVLGTAALAERVVFGGSARIASSSSRRASSSSSSSSPSTIIFSGSPSSLPGYSHARLLFLLWLTSARYQGARRLFDAAIAPAAATAAPAVAEARDDARSFLERHPGVSAAADAAHRALSSLPVLKWVLEVPPRDEGDVEGDEKREEESFKEMKKKKRTSRWWSLLG